MATIAAPSGVGPLPASDSSVHRPLSVLNPPLRGRDVARLQRALRTRLEMRGFDRDAIPVPVDGAYTAHTALACVEAQYHLGLSPETYLTRDWRGQRILTAAAQHAIRRPESRDADEVARAKLRHAGAARDPRYYADLARRLGLRGRGPKAALAFAERHVGVRERPLGSKSGPLIDAWSMLAGYTSPMPWSGCFVNVCLVAAGLPSGAGWHVGFVPAIAERARRNVDGWSWHPTGRPGDLALFDETPGGPGPLHVELVRARTSTYGYSTYGGNTTAAGAATRSGEGVVARRDDRSVLGPFHVVGFARPPYAQAS